MLHQQQQQHAAADTLHIMPPVNNHRMSAAADALLVPPASRDHPVVACCTAISINWITCREPLLEQTLRDAAEGDMMLCDCNAFSASAHASGLEVAATARKVLKSHRPLKSGPTWPPCTPLMVNSYPCTVPLTCSPFLHNVSAGSRAGSCQQVPSPMACITDGPTPNAPLVAGGL